MRGAVAGSLALTCALALRPDALSAQQGLAEGLRTIVDTHVTLVTTTTTTPSGTVKTTTQNLFPRLTVDTQALLFPSLRLSAGGVFEISLSDAESSGTFTNGIQETSSSIARLRPYVELRSTSPVLSPGIGYYRRENRTRLGRQPAVTLVSEDYAGYLGWKPEGLPQSDLQFVRTKTFDNERAFEDSTRDFGSIITRYAYQGLNVHYQGAYLDTTDRIDRLETRQVTHGGRADYSTDLFANRLRWNASYAANRQDLTTVASGDGGEVALPVVAFAGLSIVSDTPGTARLTPNPALIDGNLTASAGINLGVQGLGADAQARNLGLDFLRPTEVNRLRVWVDRELPAEIARAFSWEVYTSIDNLVWSRETVVSVAPFGPFEQRFEVDFRAVAVRYLKLVVRPLSATVIDASRYPEILVTELQPFLVESADEVRGELTRTNQMLNTDVRLLLLEAPSLYYEGSYWRRDVNVPGQDSDTLSNGLSITHRFAGMVAAYARGAYEQGTEPQGRRTARVSNATLTIDPIPTLTSSILYTGLDERIGERRDDRKGLFFQNTAQLYRGVDVQAGFGWNFTTRETGERLRDRLLNVSASVVPRSNLTLTLNYTDSTTTRSGVFTGDPEYHTRRGFVTLAFDPFRTLHLVVAEEIIAISGEKTRTTHNVGANWAPFPDGALQFTVVYNESVRPLEYGTDRIFRPGVRWAFSRQSYLDLSYQVIDSEFVALKTESRILSADLKVFF